MTETQIRELRERIDRAAEPLAFLALAYLWRERTEPWERRATW
jgi:hypothetical protein